MAIDKYGVDTEQEDGQKTASEGCERSDCPKELDHSKNPPKCPKCGYEYLQKKNS